VEENDMTITLPDEMREELERKAQAAGFASVDEYILERVLQAFAQDSETPDYPLSELTPRTREELERMLDEGMNSGPPIRVTPEFWEERRKELERRMASRKSEVP
jgi:Arc/MetJ-type ribon-helix-helix transcriptional regulator